MNVLAWLRFSKVRLKAFELLCELEDSCFEVVLIPAPYPQHSGHSIRVLNTGNPLWYSRLCANHRSKRGRMRRARTYIKRDWVSKALKEIIQGKQGGVYHNRMIDVINRELKVGNQSLQVTDEVLQF